MKVYKFGGASVKDAENVRNVEKVLREVGYSSCFLVISAMGKTTNALEEVVRAYQDKSDYITLLHQLEQAHTAIAQELMGEGHEVLTEIKRLVEETQTFLQLNKSPQYDFVYDQVISLGELLSTKIVSAYLNHQGISNTWIDAREYIKTNSDYREGKVNWEKTQHQLSSLDTKQLYITQGFIGSDEHNFTTTLGREGSDYTGAIIAYSLNAENLTIWKDVKGVLNADPRYFQDTVVLQHISYEEAIELAYYGASVIHPKTLQPLQSKEIPLYVKSFQDPTLKGTVIQKGEKITPLAPCFIVKKGQIKLSISSKSFSFIEEAVIRDVYHYLAEAKIKVNLIQISAINLYLCIEDKYNNLDQLIILLERDYNVKVDQGCSLYTIRHATQESEKVIPNYQEAMIRQLGKDTLQLVVKEDLL